MRILGAQQGPASMGLSLAAVMLRTARDFRFRPRDFDLQSVVDLLKA